MPVYGQCIYTKWPLDVVGQDSLDVCETLAVKDCQHVSVANMSPCYML